MARAALALLTLLLALPTAGAWEARFIAAPAEASLTEALLLSGSVNATAPDGGSFGAPLADGLSFDSPVSVRYCPDQAGDPQFDANCAGGETTTGARVYVLAGGVIANAPSGPATLVADATAAALGGPNVTLNAFPLGAALYVGGAAVVRAQTNALVVRPLGNEASIEVRGNEGFRTYNGSAFTLQIADFNETTLEARGAFLASPDLAVTLARAGLVAAETELRVDDLYQTLRAVQPPEKADRRSLVSGAFGLFQFVPALLDGAAAARTNLTLNEAPRGAFTFVRLENATFGFDGANWTGVGNATYMLDGDALTPRPGARAGFPIVFTIVLVVAALAARYFTQRSAATRKVRYVAAAIRVAGLVILSFLVGWTLAPLLGFSPLLDAPELAFRSRVQLALLVVGMVATAYVAIGLPAASLTRSAFAWRDRPRALVVPALVGLVATFVFILLATPGLLSFVARFVRL